MPTYPLISVNGIALDDPAARWGVRRDQPVRVLPEMRATNVIIPGRSGALWPAHDPYESGSFTINLRVFGTGGTNGQRSADLERNLEDIYFLFAQSPVEIVYQWSPEDKRKALARTLSMGTPFVYDSRDAADLTFVMDIPDTHWRSVKTFTETNSRPFLSNKWKQFEIGFMAGSTAPVHDLEFLVKGGFGALSIAGNKFKGSSIHYNINNRLIFHDSVNGNKSLYINCGEMKIYEQDGFPSWSNVTRKKDVTGSAESVGLESAMSWLKIYPDASGGTFTNPNNRKFYMSMFATGKNVGEIQNIKYRVRGRRSYL